MPKFLLIAVVGLIVIGAIIVFWPKGEEVDLIAEEEGVQELVTEFGERLKNVSLTAADAADQIRSEYSAFVSEDLLSQWAEDPQSAPGRLTSSPWPERIAVQRTRKESNQYIVEGEVIYLSSQDIVQGGASSRQPVTLLVEQENDTWRITSYTAEQQS
jgi:hypothetical protein